MYRGRAYNARVEGLKGAEDGWNRNHLFVSRKAGQDRMGAKKMGGRECWCYKGACNEWGKRPKGIKGGERERREGISALLSTQRWAVQAQKRSAGCN